MATPVKRHDTEAFLYEKKHLAVPGVGIQRPAMGERYDRTFAPVLVVNLRSVFCSDLLMCVPSFVVSMLE